MPDITSANAVLVLAVPLLLPVPQQIQGFSMDDMFTVAPTVPVETMMGVDGNLSGGYVPREKKMEIVLMAGSASNPFFDAWQAGQDAGLAALIAFGSLTILATGVIYALTNGFLTRYPPIPDARKVLQPRRFEVTWQGIIGSPVGTAG